MGSKLQVRANCDVGMPGDPASHRSDCPRPKYTGPREWDAPTAPLPQGWRRGALGVRFLEPSDPGWERAWRALGAAFEAGEPVCEECPDCGAVWEYMGCYWRGGRDGVPSFATGIIRFRAGG